MGRNDKKTSKAARRNKTIRIVQAIIVLIIVLGMIVSVIVYAFVN